MFAQSLDITRTEFNHNRSAALIEYRRHVAEVWDITCSIEHEYIIKWTGMDERYRADRESLQQKAQELISALRTHLTDETNKSLEAQKSVDDSFKDKSEGKTQQYRQMAAKDTERKRKMKFQEEKIIRLAAQISHWRRKIRNNEKESQEANDRLKQEKENLSLHFRELKATMAQFRVLENRKLAEISVLYDTAIGSLEDKLKLAEKILKYSEVTRKFETEREQVIPFTKPMSETDPEMVSQLQQFKLQLKGDPKYVAESDLFDRFYRRFNSVLLQKLSLQREKESLVQHNLRLKNMMKRFMGGMGVSQNIISKPNTLFIVNQSTNAPMRRVDQDGIPIIDGNLTIAANQLQGY
jgi:chromosome segregation ATPase